MRSKQIIALLAVLLFGLANLQAQTLEYWGGNRTGALQTIGDKTYNHKNTTVVLLEGDVTITGTITVDNWTSLCILNLTGEEHTIRNGATKRRNTPFFQVINGAKLAFNYIDVVQATIFKEAGVTADGTSWESMTAGNTKYAPINLDGGTTWATNANGEEFYEEEIDGVTKCVLTPSNEVRFYGQTGIIESFGALELFKVNIRNFHGQDYFGETNNDRGGVIMLSPRNILNELALQKVSGETSGDHTFTYEYRYTRLKCCLVEKCKSRTGVFLSIDTATGSYQTIEGKDGLRVRYQIGPDGGDYLYSGIQVEDCTIRNCVVYGDKNGWGGLIRCKGGSSYPLTLTNTTFEENFSHGDGAGLWWNAGGSEHSKCIIDGCTFRNNRAMRNAGALRLETKFEFSGSKTVVTGNECYGYQRDSTLLDQKYIPSLTQDKGNGGGIHIYGYSSDAYEVGGEGEDMTYNLSDLLEVTDNYAAGQGGGIAFDFTSGTKLVDGTNIIANFNGLTLKNNRAGMDGGGIYFNNTTPSERNYTFNIYLNAGIIDNNEASFGGGISANKMKIAYSTSDKTVTVSNNKATAGSGGGIYISDGDVSLDKVDVTNNSSLYEDVEAGEVYGGGGVYVENGSFHIQSGSIANNASGMYGGGVFVYNDQTATTNTVELSGGEIRQNNARYGGGLAACGNLNLTIQDINIQNNTAFNGGGILMKGIENGPAKLNYRSGIIRYNQAKANNGQTLETAYGLDYKTLSGLGGGFYVGQYSQLSFADEEASLYADKSFGIYSNTADNGADDLFGYNSDVKITLPNVQNMNLDGFEGGSILNLFWGEDYITNDPNYNQGLKLKGDAWDEDRTNQRVRDVFKTNSGDYFTIVFDADETSKVYQNKYLSLSLIWHQDFLLLVKEGMKAGENAIFTIYQVDDGEKKLYVTVMLTDADADANGVRTKKITLKKAGTYRIEEQPWAWAYDADLPTLEKEVGQNSSDEDRTFTFTNTPKESTPPHDESLKINYM